ncbi:MAG: SDR family NAD(P)-dependent oxidoreductase, partial [Nevskia sp.]|nr:SDR family NAD(P)-dependent oxidoreductase [Nevskia sp.]
MRSVLVTGAAGGIGSAAVRRLAGLGWRVFAGVRSPAAGVALVADCPGITPVELDICDEAAVSRARDLIAGQLGEQGLDAIVNNAGLSVEVRHVVHRDAADGRQES